MERVDLQGIAFQFPRGLHSHLSGSSPPSRESSSLMGRVLQSTIPDRFFQMVPIQQGRIPNRQFHAIVSECFDLLKAVFCFSLIDEREELDGLERQYDAQFHDLIVSDAPLPPPVWRQGKRFFLRSSHLTCQ